MKKRLPPGWEKFGANPARYRCKFDNGQMLVVTQHSPRKWYYGYRKFYDMRPWKTLGRATNRDLAMQLARTAYEEKYGPCPISSIA